MMLTGHRQQFGTPITTRRLGGMLKKVGVNATRDKDQSQRGYYYSAFSHAWKTLKVWQELAKESITPPPIDTLDGLDTLDTLKEGGTGGQLLDASDGKDTLDTSEEGVVGDDPTLGF